MNLIRHAYAKQLGLSGSTVSQTLQVTGREPELQQTVLYNIPLRRASGEVEHVTAYGISDITANLHPVNLAPIIVFFSGIQLKDIQRPTGKVDLLLGIHEARLFPSHVLHFHDNLLLYQSSFGSGQLLVGHHPLLNSGVVAQDHEGARAYYGKQVHHVLSSHGSFNPSHSKPNSSGEGGGGVQGDCRQAPAHQVC